MAKKINPVFYQEFRSITLILDSKITDCRLPIPINVLLEWLSSYESWWTKTTGINRGKNLHLLYWRYVTCRGSRLLRFIPELLEIASISSKMGCIFAVEIDLNESLDQRKLFDELINSGKVGELSIDVKITNKKYELAEYLSLIETVVKKGIFLNLMGPLDFWKDLGILDSPVLNSSSFKIIPSMTKKMKYSSRITQQTLFDSKTRKHTESIGMYSFNPCSERFQIYIAPDGVIYPCKGLIGIPSCMLGTIYDRIENTVLAGGKDSHLDFRNLAKSGPKIQFDDFTSEFGDLEPICFFHRNYILEGKHDKLVSTTL